jgi:hypothetical protein
VRETENKLGRDGLRRRQRAEGPAEPEARLVGHYSASPGRRSKSSHPDSLQGRPLSVYRSVIVLENIRWD